MNQVTNGAFRALLFLLLFLLLPTWVLKADETKKKQLADQSKKIVKLKPADSNSAKGSKKLAREQMSTRERVQKTIEYANKNEQKKRKRKITSKIVRKYQQRNDANRKLRLLKRRQKSEALKTKVLKKKQPKNTEIRLAQFAEQDNDTREKAKKKSGQ